MRESVFQGEITASFGELLPEAFYFKIPDAPIFGSAATFRRVPVYKPFDCFCYYRGKLHVFESKMHNSFLFPLNKIKDHQRAGMLKVLANQPEVDRGNVAFLVNIRGNLNKKWQKIVGEKSVNYCFMIPIQVIQDYFFSNVLSINLWTEDEIWPIERIKLPTERYGWDIRKII